jgi:hypothetical protein
MRRGFFNKMADKVKEKVTEVDPNDYEDQTDYLEAKRAHEAGKVPDEGSDQPVETVEEVKKGEGTPPSVVEKPAEEMGGEEKKE